MWKYIIHWKKRILLVKSKNHAASIEKNCWLKAFPRKLFLGYFSKRYRKVLRVGKTHSFLNCVVMTIRTFLYDHNSLKILTLGLESRLFPKSSRWARTVTKCTSTVFRNIPHVSEKGKSDLILSFFCRKSNLENCHYSFHF